MLSPTIQMTWKLKPLSPSNVISAESIIDINISYKHVVNVIVCVIRVQKKQIL